MAENALDQLRMVKINTWLIKARKDTKSGGALSEPSLPEDLILLRHFLLDTEKWLALNLKTALREPLIDLYFITTAFVRVADLYSGSYVACYETMGKDLRVIRGFAGKVCFYIRSTNSKG